jgi:hypothetical protein
MPLSMQGFIKRIVKKENPLFWILVFWDFGNGFDVQHVLKLEKGCSQGQKRNLFHQSWFSLNGG